MENEERGKCGVCKMRKLGIMRSAEDVECKI